MKRSFREVMKSKEVTNEIESNAVGLSSESFDRSYDKKSFSDLIGQLSGKSENELMRELSDLTSIKKAEGTFDIDSIQQSAKRIAPMLNDEQRRRLNEIINNL